MSMHPSAMGEQSAAHASPPPVRVVPAALDEEGAPELTEEFLASLRDGDAIGLHGAAPICECCWTEIAVALRWQPRRSSVLVGLRCLTVRPRSALDRLIAVVTS
jgi:hypothetical protein